MKFLSYKWLVAIACVAGFFMDLIDTTVVNVALPSLARDLHAANTTIEWVVNGYLLSLAIWIPASGWIGDRFGTKKTFLFALATFTCGSILCGLAWDVQSLVFFRVLQGIGGGMMTPVATAILFRTFPVEERTQASAVLTIPTALAPALGPLVGGWIVEYVGWRYIFFVNVPIGILAFLFGLVVLKEYREPGTSKFDSVGMLLSGAGLVLVLYALSTGPAHGWTDPVVLGCALLGALLLSALVWYEQKTTAPLLHLALLRDRIFRTANLILFFGFAAWLGFLFVIPLFLQQLLGATAFESGLTTFPQALGWVAVSGVADRAFKKLGARKMALLGLGGVVLTTLFFIRIEPSTDLWFLRGILLLRGISMAFATIPLQAIAFTHISAEETGRASSLFNTNRQVASSFGVALVGSVLFQLLKTTAATPQSQVGAYHFAFGAVVLLCVVAMVFAATIRDQDSVPTGQTAAPPV